MSATYKVILLGNTAVGKTSLLRRLRNGPNKPFNIAGEEIAPTIGVDMEIYRVRLENGLQVELEIWDTAGQERFQKITRQYYRGAHGVVFVYDVTNPTSFQDITRWLHYVDEYSFNSPTSISQATMRHHMRTPSCATTPIKPVFMLLGNKIDLAPVQQVVSNADGQILNDRHAMSAFFEVSAKAGEKLVDAFDRLAFLLVDNWDFKFLTQTFKKSESSNSPSSSESSTSNLRRYSTRLVNAINNATTTDDNSCQSKGDISMKSCSSC